MSKTDSNLLSSVSPLQKTPDLASASASTFYHDKGVALYYLGRNQESLRCFDKILQQNPSDLSAHEFKIDILLRMNRYSEAITSCDSALKLKPDFLPILYNKVCALAASGMKPAASSLYYEARLLDSYDASVCFYKGKALFYLDRKSDAIAILEKAVEKAYDYTEAHVQLGNTFYAASNPKEAIASFERAIKIEPNYSDAYYGLGKALFSLNKFSESLTAFQKVIELNPDSPHAYNSAGVAASAMDDKLGAVAFFSKAIKQHPVHALYYCNKGKALNDMGKGEEALACFNKADSLSQSNKLGGGLSPGNIKYINKVLAEDRVALIKQLKELQEVTLEAQKIVDNIPRDRSDSEHMVEIFEVLKRSASEATSEAINGLNTARDMTSKQTSSTALKKKLDEQHKEMETLLKQMSYLQHQQSTYGHKLSEHEVRIDEQDDILEASGAKAKAEIKASFDLLRNTNLELYAYCKTFYWTALNLFGAYRSLSTGLIQGDFYENSLSKEALLVAGARKLASCGSVIAQGIPLLGGILGALDGLIDTLYTAIKEHQFNNKVSSINKVIQAKFGIEEDISLEIAKLALTITCAKEQEILNHDTNSCHQSNNRVAYATSWLKEKLETIQQSILPSVELHDKNSTGATLALADVAMMFVYICQHSSSIVQDHKTIGEHLELIVKYGELNYLMDKIGEAILTNTNIKSMQDSVESLTPPNSPEEKPTTIEDSTYKSTELAGEESHCCCSVS